MPKRPGLISAAIPSELDTFSMSGYSTAAARGQITKIGKYQNSHKCHNSALCSAKLILGKTSIEKKKTFSFGRCPNHLNPPPDPNSGNLVLFFGRQKRRFARMTEIFFDDDNDGINDNYDDNFGNFDDNYDKMTK